MSASPKKRVLFVDDEELVLSALRNLLRRDRGRWEMVFALGAERALNELDGPPFDVVISDLHMPGMSGTVFLEKVKQRSPAAARIVLSGHVNEEFAISALPVVHQFLAMPCEGDTLRQTIERTCNLSSLLNDTVLRTMVGDMDRLPSVPAVYWALSKAVSDPRTTLDKLAALVEQDPAMVVKILQLTNSAYFGLPKRVTAIKPALQFLGIELLKAIMLSAHVFDGEAKLIDGLSVHDLQRDGLITGRIARRIIGGRDGDSAFAAAMIHDVGKIILGLCVPGYGKLLRDPLRPDHIAEHEELGVTHAEAGAYLLGMWGLPLSIIEAVGAHHGLRDPNMPCTAITAAVHFAAAYVEAAASACPPLVDLALIERAGCTAQLAEWEGIAVGELAEIALVKQGAA